MTTENTEEVSVAADAYPTDTPASDAAVVAGEATSEQNAEAGDAEASTEDEQSYVSEHLSEVRFESLTLDPAVQASIKAMGFERATHVQAAVAEQLEQNSDLLVQAKTGTGKTVAFGLPLMHRLQKGSGGSKTPAALILVPTRELASQVAEELSSLGAEKGVRVAAVYGGVPLRRQMTQLAAGVDIVVGTPGRTADHIRRENLSLEKIQFGVLDEADEMLSMGFWEAVTAILDQLPKERRLFLFSATLPYEIARSIQTYLKEAVRIDLSGTDMTVQGIDHYVIETNSDIPKPRQLLYLLEAEQPPNAIIFCNTRSEAEVLGKYLVQSGFEAEALTGRFRQKDRERVMARIKSGELRFMVATDIVSRGIDISHLGHVVNYALPEFPEVYLHRVGRTGRQGRQGVALNLIDGKSLVGQRKLESLYGIQFEKKEIPEETSILERRRKRIMQELTEKASVAEVGQHIDVAKEIAGAESGVQVIAYLLKSYFSQQAEQKVQSSSEDKRGRRREGRSDRNNEGRGSRQRNSNNKRRRRPRSNRDTVDAESLLGMQSGSDDSDGQTETKLEALPEGARRIRVNIGFNDGFKGRGAVAKKISALAGLNEGSITEVSSKRDHAILQGSEEIVSMLMERVDGAQIGKKSISVSVQESDS